MRKFNVRWWAPDPRERYRRECVAQYGVGPRLLLSCALRSVESALMVMSFKEWLRNALDSLGRDEIH
jgi:hypothetical protein